MKNNHENLEESLRGASNPERARLELSVESIDRFKDYILQGETLIKQGKYAESIIHFKNSAEAEKVGWKITPARGMILRGKMSPNKTKEYAYLISINSSSQDGLINLSYIEFANSVPGQERILPEELQQQIAVIYLEEWLHALQEITGKTLTDPDVLHKTMEEFKVGPEDEVDIGIYFKQNNIPITPIFLEAYDRKKYL